MLRLLIALLICGASLWGQCTLGVNPATGRTDCVSPVGMKCAGGTCSISATLPGAIGTGTVAHWNKFTVTFVANGVSGCAQATGCWTVNGTVGAARDGDTSQQIALTTLPARTTVHGMVITHSVQYAGTGLSAAKFTVGTAASPTALMLQAADTFDGFAAVADTTLYVVGGLNMLSKASTALVVQLDTTGANISALTAGTLEVDLLVSVLP